MCYSALVQQDLNRLSFQFKARIDENAFRDLFESRLDGNKAVIPKALEMNFLQNPSTAIGKQIQALILEYHAQQDQADQRELFKQKTRLADAERTLSQKTTKKSLEEKRISFNKIQWHQKRMEQRNSSQLQEEDSRIFPFHYAPVIRSHDGNLIIEPRRYLLRPQGQPESFDRRYNGCYNARQDSLDQVFFWKPIFGKNHGLVVISDFFENVPTHDYERRPLNPGEKVQNTVLRFHPQGMDQMLIPCLIDDWSEPNQFDLHSFAIITTDPPPEIAATGHNRCPIFLQNQHVSEWLNPQGRSTAELQNILNQREHPVYEHRKLA